MNTERFIESIRSVALNAVKESKPVSICYGSVRSIEPFQIQISQTLLLSEKFFIVLDGVKKEDFEIDDCLLLLQIQGGQSYLILGKRGEL